MGFWHHLVWFFSKHWFVSKDLLFGTTFTLIFIYRLFMVKSVLSLGVFCWRCCWQFLFNLTWLALNFYLVESRVYIIFIIISRSILRNSLYFQNNFFRYKLASGKLPSLHINLFKKRLNCSVYFWLLGW